MKILVCGDRDWAHPFVLNEVLELFEEHDVEIISGGAKGADSQGEDWANMNRKVLHIYPAQWHKGKSAGPIRNIKMLKEGRPDLVIAFHNKLADSRGTKHMVKIALKAGVPVEVYSEQHRYSEEEIAKATS